MQDKAWLYPTGYPPHCLLIILNWLVTWIACVQRSTCTSGRIRSHASVRGMSEGEMSRGEMSVPRGSMSVPQYGQQKLSTFDLVYYTYEGRACRCWVPKVYYTFITLRRRNCVGWMYKNRLPVAIATGAPNAGETGLKIKIRDFRQIAGYISNTVQDRRIVSIKVE